MLDILKICIININVIAEADDKHSGLRGSAAQKYLFYKYRGSGTRWLNHLKKHGNNVSTEILIETDDKSVIKEKGIEYSKLYNIVESQEWANLKIEEGDGGWQKSSGIRSTSFKKGEDRVKELSKAGNDAKRKKSSKKSRCI